MSIWLKKKQTQKTVPVYRVKGASAEVGDDLGHGLSIHQVEALVVLKAQYMNIKTPPQKNATDSQVKGK